MRALFLVHGAQHVANERLRVARALGDLPALTERAAVDEAWSHVGPAVAIDMLIRGPALLPQADRLIAQASSVWCGEKSVASARSVRRARQRARGHRFGSSPLVHRSLDGPDVGRHARAPTSARPPPRASARPAIDVGIHGSPAFARPCSSRNTRREVSARTLRSSSRTALEITYERALDRVRRRRIARACVDPGVDRQARDHLDLLVHLGGRIVRAVADREVERADQQHPTGDRDPVPTVLARERRRAIFRHAERLPRRPGKQNRVPCGERAHDATPPPV